tara:strand:+ start:2148 stop:3767 length:1620 start_codon:yes stop_codon:yes gene_type:complete
MAIKRFIATADTTITNALLEDLTHSNRATGSNMGLADSLEVYSVYAQVSASATTLFAGTATGSTGYSQELSRVLVKFPVTTADNSTNSIQAQRTSGVIPASGSVSFYLKMYNVAHHETLPVGAKVNIFAASSSWEEGRGVDLDTYKDKTLDNVGANWMRSAGSTSWNKPGGDFHSASSNSAVKYAQTFANGNEDIEVDISELVEQWIAGTKSNYGVGVFLTASQEAYFSSSTGLDLSPTLSGGILHNLEGATTSYYTKKFSARSSEYFFKRPCIEARWDSATKDERGTFYYSSSLATAEENLQTLYFYNYFRGQLRDIPAVGAGAINLKLYSGSTGPDSALVLVADATHVYASSPTIVNGGRVSTGIYSASFCLTAAATPLTTVYDVWYTGVNEYHTGTFKPKKLVGSQVAPSTKYVSNITNLRNVYHRDETARFRLYTRLKDWNPTIYTKAVAAASVDIVESGSYEVYRTYDDMKVIPYGTSSTLHTQMSYDESGSYFDLDMEMLEGGYMYGIRLAYYNNSVGGWVEQPSTFKFRVED